MAGERILFPQFRDEQEDSRYPFTDTATLRSSELRLEIGRDSFIDASLYIIDGDQQAYISAIIVTTDAITIRLGDSGSRERATAVYNPLSPPENGVLEVFDIFGRPAGLLLSTPLALASFGSWPTGTHTFALAATEFVASVVIPAKEPGVRAVKTPASDILAGDVWLVGDRGVVLRKEDDTTIRVDIIGEPLFSRYLCDDLNRFQPKIFLQTITIGGVTCGPDDFGNFNFTATGHGATDTVLRIYPQDGNIRIDTVGRKVV